MVRYRRRPSKQSDMVRDLYPSRFATTTRYPNSDKVHQGAAEDAETDAIKCAQCAAPLTNPKDIGECWNCTSDNFYGYVYGP